jgi:hypothetical protein
VFVPFYVRVILYTVSLNIRTLFTILKLSLCLCCFSCGPTQRPHNIHNTPSHPLFVLSFVRSLSTSTQYLPYHVSPFVRVVPSAVSLIAHTLITPLNFPLCLCCSLCCPTQRPHNIYPTPSLSLSMLFSGQSHSTSPHIQLYLVSFLIRLTQ